MRPTRLLVVLLLLAVAPDPATAQLAPTFSQTFNYPTGHSTTATRPFDLATYDTTATFKPLAPPDNDYGTSDISTELHYSGSSLHWALNLGLNSGLNLLHAYTPTLDCDPIFKLHGLDPADSATVRVRVIAKVAVVEDGGNGLFRGRIAIFTLTARDSLDLTHGMSHTPTTTVDTLEVPVVVHGGSPLFTFHLNLLNHVEMIDPGYSHGQNLDADIYFLDVPPGMVVANAYGYGAEQLGVATATGHVGRLIAHARADGRVVLLGGVTPGEAGAELGLFDVTGRRIAGGHAVAPVTGQVQLLLPNALTSGVYFVRCADAAGARSARFVFAR
jgi:hypothetical protein